MTTSFKGLALALLLALLPAWALAEDGHELWLRYRPLAGQAKGEKVEVIFPASGTVVAPRPAMILKWSKQQDDAKKFVDYMLSDAGQKEVAKTYLMPARTDIPASRPLINDLKVITIDAKTVYAKRDETLKTFAATFAK